MPDNFKISKEKKKELLEAIKSYFKDEREEDLGDLAAGQILDFILDKIAPEIYNQGVLDSYAFINDKLPDLLEIQK